MAIEFEQSRARRAFSHGMGGIRVVHTIRAVAAARVALVCIAPRNLQHGYGAVARK